MPTYALGWGSGTISPSSIFRRGSRTNGQDHFYKRPESSIGFLGATQGQPTFHDGDLKFSKLVGSNVSKATVGIHLDSPHETLGNAPYRGTESRVCSIPDRAEVRQPDEMGACTAIDTYRILARRSRGRRLQGSPPHPVLEERSCTNQTNTPRNSRSPSGLLEPALRMG